MKINEITSDTELQTLVQYLIGQSEYLKTNPEMTMDQFIAMADGLGIHMSPDKVMDIMSKPPLSNMVKDVNQDVIYFGDKEDIVKMPVDKARKIVSKMAKNQIR